MNNYFTTQRVHWYNFSPNDIVFKSNNITKKLMPEENLLSYRTKTDRDTLSAKKSGATVGKNNWGNAKWLNNNHRAVHVKLTNVKEEYVTADIDFVDVSARKDSLGGLWSMINVLVYINSFHNKHVYQQVRGNWQRVKTNPVPLPDEEGYRISYGGQGEGMPMEYRDLIEIADITEAIRKFLIDRVLALKRGELSKKALTGNA
tara:strand:- start:235 stop:843 length:609 start_codon:yes stop_codon:yes gene_type:complete